ncbi:MAG: sigma-70 family RNA polymerase sigma factor [Clostridiales Family XIII bacterium]|nr:sigma-70 family RNA polymerase sigma factor [Clostridiales Family XIII bacterium]
MDNEAIGALALKAKNGDRDALSALCEAKARTVLYHALKHLGNREDAQDAAQESLIRICGNIGGLKDPASFNAWAQKIVLHTCFEFRKKRHDTAVRTESVTEREFEERDRDVLPQAYAEDADGKEILRRIVSSLPPKRRETVLLYYYDGLSYTEIAEVTGVTVSTVSTNLLRAKESIREAYERYEKYGRERQDGKNGQNGKGWGRKVKRGEVMKESLGIFALLPEALREEAAVLVTDADIAFLKEGTLSALANVQLSGAGGAVVSAGNGAATLKMLAVAALITSLTVTCVFMALDPVPTGRSEVAVREAPVTDAADEEAPDTTAPPAKETPDGYTETTTLAADEEIVPGDAPATPIPQETVPTVPAPLPERLNPVVPEPPATPEDTDLSVSFLEGDCSCGHVNPKEAFVSGRHAVGEIRWSIEGEADGSVLYTGTGGRVSIPLAALAERSGNDGVYILRFSVTDAEGHTRNAQRWFLVELG